METAPTAGEKAPRASGLKWLPFQIQKWREFTIASNRTIVIKNAASRNLEPDDSWRCCLARTSEMLIVLAGIYLMSVGPVFRMYMHREISARALVFYRPIMSVHSPFFRASCRYIVIWM